MNRCNRVTKYYSLKLHSRMFQRSYCPFCKKESKVRTVLIEKKIIGLTVEVPNYNPSFPGT